MKIKYDKPTLFEDLRYANRLTGKEVAAKLDISPSAYSHLEKGSTWPSFATLLKTMEVFDVSFEKFAEYYRIREAELTRSSLRTNSWVRRQKRRASNYTKAKSPKNTGHRRVD